VPWRSGRAVTCRRKADKIPQFSTSSRAAAVALAAAVLLPAAPPGIRAAQGLRQTGSGPAIGTVHTIGRAAQAAARAFWTPGRMAGATTAQPGVQDAAKAGPPPGTPTATSFRGVPGIRLRRASPVPPGRGDRRTAVTAATGAAPAVPR